MVDHFIPRLSAKQLITPMPLFIFECENCNHWIKKTLDQNPGKKIQQECPKCTDNQNFKLIREGDPQRDWFSNVLKIHNKRRRPGDQLHITDNRGKDDEKKKDKSEE